jgi:hypothetical protein
MDTKTLGSIKRLEDKVMILGARLDVQNQRTEKLEAKAWPIHNWFNRIQRWKRGQKWWIDGLLDKLPKIIKMDNSAGKGRGRWAKSNGSPCDSCDHKEKRTT